MTAEERRQSLASETEDVAREDQLFMEKAFADAAMQQRMASRQAAQGTRFSQKENDDSWESKINSLQFDAIDKSEPEGKREHIKDVDINQLLRDKNIQSGLNALQEIADGADYVPNAMVREELEQFDGDKNIGFYWGKMGDAKRNFKGGYGIAHIGGKHGIETVKQILNVLANGSVERYIEGNKTVVFTNGKFECLVGLTRFGNKESWGSVENQWG